MAGREKKVHAQDGNAHLYLGPSSESAWQQVILPWFRSIGLTACRSRRPVVVVVPHPAQGQYLRHLLLEHRLPLLGVTFASPPQLREILAGSETKLPVREHLRLLLAVAAEQQTSGNNSTDEETIAAQSVQRAPDYLLRTIDELNFGGWTFEQAGPPSFRKLVSRFERFAGECGFTSLQQADRTALERARSGEKVFADILISGFDGAHWPLWPVLRAAVAASENSTIVLSDPRDEARDIDECWIGTWEQTFGAANPIGITTSTSPKKNGSAQLDLFDSPPRPPIHFLLGQEITEEANAIVTLAIRFLGDSTNHCIGVLFPGAGALSRSVAARLDHLEIPHFDGIGHLVAPTLEDLSWLAWLRLQESNRLYPLLNFLSTLEDSAPVFAHATRETIDNVLRRAAGEILVDDLTVLRVHCAQSSKHEAGPSVASALAEVAFLPATSTLAEFIELTHQFFQQWKWNDRSAELRRLTFDWTDRLPVAFSRGTYLRWLGEVLGKPKRARDPLGDHPYSRIHLLSFAEAEGQQWSHLILAGLNEGAWPPSTNESDFVRDAEIEALNDKIKVLNRRIVIQGRHGEGQWTVQEGKTLCLGASERRQIAQRQIANLVESATSGLGITASLYTESVPRRIANPSEAFTRLYFEQHGKALSQTTLEALREQTSTWIQNADLPKPGPVKNGSIDQTRIAFDARRRDGPAGEFEFALREPPAKPISFSASESERLFKSPALIWMKAFLGVQAQEQDSGQWNLAVGNWVHEWLRQIIDNPLPGTFGELGSNLAKRVESAAHRSREAMDELMKKCGRAVPDWWTSTWSNAAYIANCFVKNVAHAPDWHYAGTEWSLRNLPAIPIPETPDGFKLRGRIDLILAKAAPRANRFEKIPIWVIDYKTGKRNSLRSSQWKSDEDIRLGVMTKLLKGDGVQVALYALALHQLGADDIGISLLARGLDLAAPQLKLQEVAQHEQIWRELAEMQRTGVFGMRGYIRSEFGFTGDYPLATLPVDFDLLETKWPLTHPGFATRDVVEED